jgi:hypothetical protein
MLRAVAKGAQQLEVAPDRGLLIVLASVDGETGSYDRIVRHRCTPDLLQEQMKELLGEEELLRAIENSDQAHGDARSEVHCRAKAKQAVCSGSLGGDDGGPRGLQLVFLLDDLRGPWVLDAVVYRDDLIHDQRFIDKHLRRARTCPSCKR